MTRSNSIFSIVATLATVMLLAACTDGPRFSPLGAGTKVLAFGDSVTFGVGAGDGQTWPANLASETGWEVINAGISGDTASNARSRIAAALSKHSPRLVIIELGGNDFLRQSPARTVKEDLRAIIKASLASGAVTVLVAVPRLSLLRASVGSLADSPIYAELAQEEDVVLIEDVFSDVLSDDALRADQIHPNASGYRELSAGFLAALREAGLAY